MSVPSDDRAPEVPAEQNGRSRRRKRAALAAAGLAAILSAGVYAAATHVVDHRDASVTEDVALRPVAPFAPGSPAVSSSSGAAASSGASSGVASSGASSGASSAGASSGASSSSGAAQSAAPAKAGKPGGTATVRPADPDPAPSKKSVAQEIADARAAAARDGHPLQRPLTAAPGAAAAIGPVTVTNQGSLKTGGTMRVVSARYDLTGQRELLWAADRGKPVGSARCTQNFRFSNDAAPKERPSMVLCWRTSASRSVLTVAVASQGRPAAAKSVAVIDRRWAELG
ncbi:MAG TPA: hypothetical protein VFR35_04790 [Actinoplanes sp.]|nr:hypothetical protein [Actinoplanes sp.]